MSKPIAATEFAAWRAACEEVEKRYDEGRAFEAYEFGSLARTAIPRLLDEREELTGKVKAMLSERDGPRGYVESATRLRTENEQLQNHIGLLEANIANPATVEILRKQAAEAEGGE